MSKIQRGADRRKLFIEDEYSSTCRRSASDPREFAFISKQKLYEDSHYADIEPILKECDLISLKKHDVLLAQHQTNEYVYLVKSGELN